MLGPPCIAVLCGLRAACHCQKRRKQASLAACAGLPLKVDTGNSGIFAGCGVEQHSGITSKDNCTWACGFQMLTQFDVHI